MIKEFTNFVNRRKFGTNLAADPIFGNMLLNVEDEQWKRLRAIITPTFSVGKLKRMKYAVEDTVQTLINNIEQSLTKSSIQNTKPFFNAFTLNTIIQIAFGLKIDAISDPNNPVIVNANKIFMEKKMSLSSCIFMCRVLLVLFMPRIAKYFKVRISDAPELQFCYKLSLEIIKNKRGKVIESGEQGSGEKGQNFIELLLEAEEAQNQLILNENDSNKTVKYMSNDEIVSQCVMFFIVGFDTTSTTLTLACHLLATHPEIQQKLYEEIASKVTQDHETNLANLDLSQLVTFDLLNRFEYLQAIINETLRLYTPGVVTERTASRDITLETSDGRHQIHLKKDDVIQFPLYAIHRSAANFADPEHFDPDRFIGEPQYPKYAYIPFGSGPRNCVARSLALMEVKMALLNVIWRYRLSVCEKTKIPVEFDYQMNLLKPGDVFLKFEKRF